MERRVRLRDGEAERPVRGIVGRAVERPVLAKVRQPVRGKVCQGAGRKVDIRRVPPRHLPVGNLPVVRLAARRPVRRPNPLDGIGVGAADVGADIQRAGKGAVHQQLGSGRGGVKRHHVHGAERAAPSAPLPRHRAVHRLHAARRRLDPVRRKVRQTVERRPARLWHDGLLGVVVHDRVVHLGPFCGAGEALADRGDQPDGGVVDDKACRHHGGARALGRACALACPVVAVYPCSALLYAHVDGLPARKDELARVAAQYAGPVQDGRRLPDYDGLRGGPVKGDPADGERAVDADDVQLRGWRRVSLVKPDHPLAVVIDVVVSAEGCAGNVGAGDGDVGDEHIRAVDKGDLPRDVDVAVESGPVGVFCAGDVDVADKGVDVDVCAGDVGGEAARYHAAAGDAIFDERPGDNGAVDAAGAVDHPSGILDSVVAPCNVAAGNGAFGQFPVGEGVVEQPGRPGEELLVSGELGADQPRRVPHRDQVSNGHALDAPSLGAQVSAPVVPAQRGATVRRERAEGGLAVLDKDGVGSRVPPRRRDPHHLPVVHGRVQVWRADGGAVGRREARYVDQPCGRVRHPAALQRQPVHRGAVAGYGCDIHDRVVQGRPCRSPVGQGVRVVELVVCHVGARGRRPEALPLCPQAVASGRDGGGVVVRHGDLVGAGEPCGYELRHAVAGALVRERDGRRLPGRHGGAARVGHAGYRDPACRPSGRQQPRDRGVRHAEGQPVRGRPVAGYLRHGAARDRG